MEFLMICIDRMACLLRTIYTVNYGGYTIGSGVWPDLRFLGATGVTHLA